MRSVRVGERRVDVHGSMFAAYAHESLFGRGMGEDLDRAAESLPSLARVAYSMALAADRATGRQTPTLATFQQGISQDPALLAALRAECSRLEHFPDIDRLIEKVWQENS